MADDIFLTPEEQDERARKWLKENGPALIIGIALGLGGIFGWNQYKSSIQVKAEQASAIYTQAIDSVRESDLANIDSQLSELKDQYAKSPYTSKVALLKAKQLSLSDLPAAYEELQWVLDNSPEFGVRHTARIRQAKIKLALGELEAAKSLASHSPTQGFESNYAELLGDIALAEKDESTARVHYQTAIDTLPDSLAGYAQVLTIKLNRLSGDDAVKSAEASTSNANSNKVPASTEVTSESASEALASTEEEMPESASEAPASTEDEVPESASEAPANTEEETPESASEALESTEDKPKSASEAPANAEGSEPAAAPESE